jgi:hypothetical protein
MPRPAEQSLADDFKLTLTEEALLTETRLRRGMVVSRKHAVAFTLSHPSLPRGQNGRGPQRAAPLEAKWLAGTSKVTTASHSRSQDEQT